MEGIGRESGRLSAIVKGSRGRGSAGILEPPVLLQVRFRQGSSLDTLAQPVLQNAFLPLRRDLSRLLVAGFLGRLFVASLPERVPEPEALDLLLHLFESLGQGVSPQLCGFWGQERLLELLGLSPELDCCVLCGSEQVSGFSGIDGGVLCGACYRGQGFALSDSSRTICQQLRFGALLDLKMIFSPADTRAIGRLYKEHFQAHLGLPAQFFKRVIPQKGSL